MVPRVLFVLLALLLAAPDARAQASEVSTLWREWAVLEAEWRAERRVYGGDRQRQSAIREALAAGRDPRAVAPKAAPRPAGPTDAPRPGGQK